MRTGSKVEATQRLFIHATQRLTRPFRKRCPTSVAQTDCSGRGTCTYRDYNGEPVPFCAASNELCTAICDCSSGYAGEGCQWSQVEKDELAAARLELLMGVSDVQESEATMEAARTSALAQASVVKDLVSRPDELSEQSVQLAVELLDNIASVRLAAENDERQANVDLATAVSSIISAQAKVRKVEEGGSSAHSLQDSNSYSSRRTLATTP